jgi:hypothetical protein
MGSCEAAPLLPTFFHCVRFESTRRLSFEHASALCTTTVRSPSMSASVCRFIATGCVPLGGSSSFSFHVLFSPILYLSLPHYHSTMESGLLPSKPGWAGILCLWHGGLLLIYINQTTMLQVHMCQLCIPSAPVPRSIPCYYSRCESSAIWASSLIQKSPSSK